MTVTELECDCIDVAEEFQDERLLTVRLLIADWRAMREALQGIENIRSLEWAYNRSFITLHQLRLKP